MWERTGLGGQPPFEVKLPDSAHSKVTGQNWSPCLQLVAKEFGKYSLAMRPIKPKKSDREGSS